MILRLGLMVLLIVAIWNPPLPWRSPSQDILVVLDDSFSMKRYFDRGLWPQLAKRIDQISSRARVGLVRYGATAAVELSLASNDTADLQSILRSPAPPRRNAVSRWETDSQSALTTALRLSATNRAATIILVTDGLDTHGRVEHALHDAKAADVPIFWLDPKIGNVSGDRWIQEMRVPVTVRLGEQALITVALGGDSKQNARLRISVNNRLISDTAISLTPGETTFHRTRYTPRVSGNYEVYATLEGTDDVPENDTRTAVLHAAGPLPVLIVSRNGGATQMGRSMVAGGQSPVEIDPQGFPQRADGLRAYSTVVLDDIPIGAMNSTSWNALSKAVREKGVGLVVLGGPHSFSAGGYRHSKLEAILPVIAEAGVPDGQTAVQFVVDKSGSMDRDQKTGSRFSIAKYSVVETARGLVKGDMTGLIWFDVAAHTALPLDVYPSSASVIEDAWTVRPSGGTALTSALQAALDRLSNVTVEQRLLVLVTDGQLPAGEDLSALYDTIREEGVDVISLVIGESNTMSTPLAALSKLNNGALFQIDRVAELPHIMRREVERRRNPARLGPTAPRVKTPTPYLKNIGDWPSLAGYMVTRARPSAQVYLESKDGDPLFAMGRFGAGRVVALPGGFGAWAKAWRDWRHWGRFAGGLMQFVAVGNNNPSLDVKIENEAGRLKFTVDAIRADGEWSREPAAVSFHGGETGERSIILPQVAPGHYAGYAKVEKPGRYSAIIGVGEQVLRREIMYTADHEFHAGSGPVSMAKFEKEGLVTAMPVGDFIATAVSDNGERPSRHILLVFALGWFFLMIIYERTGFRMHRIISGSSLFLARIFHRQRNTGS